MDDSHCFQYHNGHHTQINTLGTKYKAILEVEKGLKTKTQIAKDFNVPINTLCTWLKKADDYKKAYETHSFGPQNKRMNKVDIEDMNDALHAWMREAHAHDIPISGLIFQAKAQEMAAEMGHPKFKTRKGIGFCNIKGGAKAVNPETSDAWKNTLLLKLLEEYSPDDI